MKLWSLHDPSFSLIDGTVNHLKSHYYTSVHGIKDAYHKLWPRIGQPDGQIVWCYTTGDQIARTRTPRVLWRLDVPGHEILCCVDDVAWNNIIGARGIALPPHLQHEWNRQPRTGDWWDELIIPDKLAGRLRTALICHPVREDYVTERLNWQARA
ncbi:MAG: hypothetical protein WBD40_23555 [Tepidisphaeraceae bacterium]